jgi:dTDP-4-dehydrorhamnose reductase
MKILLFGGSGQLGFEIQKRALDLDFQLVSPVQSEIDITEARQVQFLAEKIKPDLIINSAAYTAVDKAESEREAAFAVNAEGAGVVARAASQVGARSIYISTDYVFDGTLARPLKETDPTRPLNVYGESKLLGEQNALKEGGGGCVVVRTSSLHGQRGENFVHTMLKLFAEREEVSIVSDQFMSPTWAGWLAEVLLDLARLKTSGLFHASCAGAISWFDFAEQIWNSVRGSNPQIQRCRLKKVGVSDFPRPAKRPAYSVFDCSKLAQVLGRSPISWQDGLKGHLNDIGRIKLEK